MSQNYRSDVYSYEIDDSFSTVFTSNTYAILFGAAKRGPVEPQFITDYENAVALFGKPDASVSKMMYEAMSFFRQGSGAWFQRVVPDDIAYGGALVQNKQVLGIRTLGVTPLTADNPQDVDLTTAGGATTLDDNLLYFYSWGPGSYSKSIRIAITSNNLIAPELNPATSVALTPVGQTSLLAAATYNYVVTAYNTYGETVASSPVSVVIAAGQAARVVLTAQVSGAAGYRVYRKLSTDSTYAFIGTMAQGQADYYDYGRTTPAVGTMPPVTPTIATQKVFTVSVYDETVSKTVARETYECSLNYNTAASGQQTEIEEQINNNSKLIRVVSNGKLLSTEPTMYSITPFYLTEGDSGSAISDGNIILALDKFKDAELYPASLILDCGYTQVTVQKAINSLVSERKYMIGLLSVPSNQQSATQAVNYRAITLGLNSNRCALFCNDHLIKDPYNDVLVYIPPAGVVAAALAYTDRVANPAFSPAGFRRGVAPDTIKLRHTYDKTQRDLMAAAQINYFTPERGYGAVLRESYTLQTDYSSLSYISVRRIIDIAEENTERSLRLYLQEPNDEMTALQLASQLRDYYQLMVDGRMIKRFEVTTRTSDADIQLGNRRVYTVIEPLLPAVRIHHTTIISKQGADFQEVLERYTAA